MNPTADKPVRRGVYCVLSSRSLPYARHAMASLVAHSVDDLDLTLITDSAEDKIALVDAMQALAVPDRHRWRVAAQSEADDLAVGMLSRHPNIAAFRFGHPCWRKVTDPMLFAPPGGEMVILDPDLYFPNRFRFEPTPKAGLLLMHQPPHCLLPPEVVIRAYDEGVRLAHHTDIGVAQASNGLDLDFLDALIARLGGTTLPRVMHVESIVWAALAMRMGGGLSRSGALALLAKFAMEAGAAPFRRLRADGASSRALPGHEVLPRRRHRQVVDPGGARCRRSAAARRDHGSKVAAAVRGADPRRLRVDAAAQVLGAARRLLPAGQTLVALLGRRDGMTV